MLTLQRARSIRFGFRIGASLVLMACCAARGAQTDIIGPPGSGQFGSNVVHLPNGNFVVADPNYSIPAGAAMVGAVYLYNPSGTIISTLTGSTANDQVGGGGVVVLSNGNYVVISLGWDNGAVSNAGAVTWGNGTSGVSGTVSAANSLVGSTSNDTVGISGVTTLSNGNYVVISTSWDNGAATNAGAVTWGNGATGVSGTVSAANSLVGGTTNDTVGSGGVTALNNGNYVVRSQLWDNGTATNAGAVTWGNGTTGVSGAVSAANSLVGSTSNDAVGIAGVTELSNGNYVVNSPNWDNGAVVNAGAVTWGNGTSGVSGAVSAANSLVGSTAGDNVGLSGVTALSNGNYVVNSSGWDNGATANVGAVTWGNGTTGVSGAVSAANSLVGSTAGDSVGGVIGLSNGNYVVRSPSWDNGAATDAGAVTWGNGVTGISGVVSAANSLVGSTTNDNVGSGVVTALNNGNYVVSSPNWDNGATTNAGAVTWGNGTTGISGTISASNSLVGGTADNIVGGGGVAALSNGNYVVRSPNWDNGAATDVGAVTWGNGATGLSGTVAADNSLVGGTANDTVGSSVTALNNGNYVVESPLWDNGAATNAGAVTWGNGATGLSGTVSAANSLVGSTSNDNVGSSGVTALTNGNYVVRSPSWDNGTASNAGAVTWGNGATGVSGTVSAGNSLVGGTANDAVGNNGVVALNNGNYVVRSNSWDNIAAAATDAGSVTWGSGTSGVSGIVSAANSLLGSTTNDTVGIAGVTALSNGNYVVNSSSWDNGAATNAGAVSLGNGSTGVSGVITAGNSVRGTAASGGGQLNFSYDAPRLQLAVGRPLDNRVTIFGAGAANKLVIVQQPVSAASTAVLTPAVAVQIQDASGNPVNSTANVSLAIGTNPNGGTLSGTATIAAVTGTATFNNLSIDKVGTGYTLSASSTGLPTVVSTAFNIVAGPAAKLAFSTQPGNATAGASFSTQPAVTLQDASGNTVIGSPQTVTLAIQDGSIFGGVLGGTLSLAINPGTGVAEFSGLSIDKPGAYTLTATGSTVSTTPGTVVSSIFNIVNSAPAILSGPTATPSTAGVGQSVTFNVAANDPDNQSLSFTWSIDGNTLTGPSPTYTFQAPGIYTATVSVSDGLANPVTGFVVVTVVAPAAGDGTDSDGDGFSDDFETAVGTNPNNPNDSPTGGGAPAVAKLTQSKLKIALNFSKSASDSLSFAGTLPIAAAFSPQGKTAIIDVGGIIKSVTLDAKGKAPKGTTAFSVGIKSNKGVVAAQTAKYSVKLSKGAFAASLADEGLTDTTVKGASATVLVRIVFGGVIYQDTQSLAYTAKAGSKGSASAPKP
jgi:hypothetical protein